MDPDEFRRRFKMRSTARLIRDFPRANEEFRRIAREEFRRRRVPVRQLPFKRRRRMMPRGLFGGNLGL